jgi:hypothetical protein
MMSRKLTRPITWRLDRASVGCDGGDAESEGFWVGAGVVDRRLDNLIQEDGSQYLHGFSTIGAKIDLAFSYLCPHG